MSIQQALRALVQRVTAREPRADRAAAERADGRTARRSAAGSGDGAAYEGLRDQNPG